MSYKKKNNKMSSFVTKITQDNEIVIFSKPNCSRCDVIKLFLKAESIDFIELDVTTIEDFKDFEDIDSMEVVEFVKNTCNESCNPMKYYPFCFYKGFQIDMNLLKKKFINLKFDDF